MHSYRIVATGLALWLALLFTGCSSPAPQAPPYQGGQPGGQTSYGGQTYGQPQLAPTREGMSNRQKVVLLMGAAALYYLYKHHQNAAVGPQYYLSRNGGVYYRDAQHQVHWVQAPSGGIQVPADEASQYQDFQGYQGQSNGRTLQSVGSGP